MAADETEEAVTKAAALADKVPEKYQQKAFELLLQSFLSGGQPAPPRAEEAVGEAPAASAKREFKMPIELRALFSQYGVPEESLQKLFEIEGSDAVPKFALKTTKKARAQIQLALMLALESLLKGGKLEFGAEEVRTRCKEHRAYAGANFNVNFKHNSNLFKSLEDDEHIELTPDGKAELAQTIGELTK